jgi:hypothetical protein
MLIKTHALLVFEEGTVAKVKTSGHEPWENYAVKGSWIDVLWTQQKLSHQVYLSYAAKVRLGFLQRKRQVEAVQEHERHEAFLKAQEDAKVELAKLQKPFRVDALARVEQWRTQYKDPDFRYKFHVLRGDSRSGKTTFAKTLFSRPFVQTVQDAASPDLRDYDWTYHGMIVFDNVNDMDFVMKFRALLQANNDVHVLGSSATGMYSYRVWLWKVPVVLTVDTQAAWDSNNKWVKENCWEVTFAEPCYTV